jgi:hypothetical protein
MIQEETQMFGFSGFNKTIEKFTEIDLPRQERTKMVEIYVVDNVCNDVY